jgi:hypothetical protein
VDCLGFQEPYLKTRNVEPTTGWLCEHIYGKRSKSQRTALIRAIKKMKLFAGWKFEPGWDELQLINERFHAPSGQPRGHS